MSARGARLVRLADLGDRHMGRHVEIRGLRGVLVGVIPVGGRVSLALLIGGARVFSDGYDADEGVEVLPKEGKS
jgi:hypothetical protein